MGPFRLVAMGRAFHWMDRAATLAMLDRMVTPDGGVALFHDAHPPVEENAWFKTLCDVQGKFGRTGDAAAAAIAAMNRSSLPPPSPSWTACRSPSARR